MTASKPASDKFELIEAGRGIAALCVVLMHAANLMDVPHFSGHVGLGGVFNFGYVGVDFFFVLSGFVITHAHLRDIGRPERIPRYLWRRFSRIYPIFWISLALAVAVTAAGRLAMSKPVGLEFGATDVFATLLLLPIAEPKFIGVAWSLQYEVMFYLLFVAALVHRWALAALLAAWVLGVALRAGGWLDHTLFGLLTGHTFQFILGGLLAAWVSRQAPAASPRAWFAGAALAIVAAVALERLVFNHHGEAGRIALGLASALMIYALYLLDVRRTWRPPRPLSALGSVSYSVYLTHIIFISITYTVLRLAGLYHALPEAAIFTLAVTVALLCSCALGLWVELPLVQRFKRLGPATPRQP